MADTTKPLPSPSVPVVDRLRRWSPEWYPFIKQLLTNIKTQAASLFTIETTIDEINGKWSVSISENGRVTGLVKLDASSSLTTFSVLADKFIVVHPSANNTTIQAFVIGNIAGTPTVGINGNLIVDNTILARHIVANTITADKLNVSSLSAITANVGTVTAGVLRSSDGLMVIDLNNKTIQITT